MEHSLGQQKKQLVFKQVSKNKPRVYEQEDVRFNYIREKNRPHFLGFKAGGGEVPTSRSNIVNGCPEL